MYVTVGVMRCFRVILCVFVDQPTKSFDLRLSYWQGTRTIGRQRLIIGRDRIIYTNVVGYC